MAWQYFSHMTVSHLFSNKMAVKMVLFWFSLVLSIIGSNASGELSILHSPQSLKFSGESEAFESFLKEIFSASLGLSVEENSKWNGLSIADPFNTPEAAVEVYIDGVSSLKGAADLKAKNYPLIVDEYEPDTFEMMRHRIRQHFTNGGNNLVKIRLSDYEQLNSYPDVFGSIPAPKPVKQSLEHLKYTVEEDYQFLSELEALKSVIKKVPKIKPDNIIDFYNLRFRSLHALSDFHGPNSLQTKEAKKLLGEALEQLSAAFTKAYDGSVLVTVVTTDVAHTRRTIRATPEETKSARASNNTSNATDANFAVMFNIILWFAIVLIFTLVAIVYVIMDMDPGRDSIIYRMTSTRMKKDN